LAGETATDVLPRRAGRPLVSFVHVSPASVLFQMPLPGPPERTYQGIRWWSQ
jgi:hypothetical protein